MSENIVQLSTNIIYQIQSDADADSEQNESPNQSSNSFDKKNQQDTQISQTRPSQLTITKKLKITPIQTNKYNQTIQNQSQTSSQPNSPTKLIRNKREKINIKNKQLQKIEIFQQQENQLFVKSSIQYQVEYSQRIFQLKKDQKLQIKIIKQQIKQCQQENQLIYQNNQQNQSSNQSYESEQSQRQSMFQKQKQNPDPLKLISRNKDAVIAECKLKSFIVRQIPKGYKISLYLNIQTKILGLSTQYNIQLKQTGQNLLSAKKQHFKLYSSYIISDNKNYITKRDNQYIAILDANFSGTKYSLRHHRSGQEENQLITQINFENNLFGHKGIKNIQILKLSHELSLKEKKRIFLQEVLQRKQFSKINKISTIKPKLDKGRYKIDFHGKVKIASTKNIILQTKQKKQCFLMAKQSQNRFIIEISSPFSILQAFGIALANLDSKLMVN